MNTATLTPETATETDAQRELRELASNIETYRVDAGMTKSALLARYPELGTDRTYSKIVGNDFAELKIEERWLPAYSTAWAQIQGEEGDDDSELITDLHGPMELCRSYLENRNETGTARFILILGDSGVGKTSAVKVMRSKPYGVNIIAVEASESWKNVHGVGSTTPLLRAIARQLGLKDLPSGPSRLQEVVCDALSNKRRCIVVEEAHHLCPGGVNTLKALINLTPSLIVATAMPVLWERLSGSRRAWAECKQLTGNRLAELVHLRLQVPDISRFLSKRLEAHNLSEEFFQRASMALAQEAPRYGNMRLVAATAKRFSREVRAGQEASLDTFANALKTEIKRR